MKQRMDQILSKFPCLIIGGAGIALIKLTEIKDVTAVAVGVVTIVCLIYNTFFREQKRKREK